MVFEVPHITDVSNQYQITRDVGKVCLLFMALFIYHKMMLFFHSFNPVKYLKWKKWVSIEMTTRMNIYIPNVLFYDT